MLNALKWSSKDLAIDLGTVNTLAYVRGSGIVLNEPSVVAKNTRNGKIIAIGHDAKAMVGMTPNYITTVHPLRNGVIADLHMAEALLQYCIKKALNQSVLRRPRIVIAIPFRIMDIEKKAVRILALRAGAREVTLLSESVAAAIGAGLPIEEPSGNMIVDTGGGTTEVAIISLAGIVCGHSIQVAGDKMDEKIIQYIKRKYNILIGTKTAEVIKKTLGSASTPESKKKIELRGCDLLSGKLTTITLSGKEIRDALKEPISSVVAAIKATLEKTPPELSADIMDRGITLTGGSALLQNLSHKIKQEVGVPVQLANDPLTTVVRGIGSVLTNPSLLKKVAVS